MRIILVGLPGAGKSFQGAALAKFYTVPHYNLGDLVRAEIEKETELSQRIKSSWSNSETWQPLADDIAISIAQPIIEQHSWIIDGFPRNVNQAKIIQEVDFVIYLKISPTVAMYRTQQRARGDEDKTEQRLALECDRLRALLEFWQQQNKLTTINGEFDKEIVFGQILDGILPF